MATMAKYANATQLAGNKIGFKSNGEVVEVKPLAQKMQLKGWFIEKTFGRPIWGSVFGYIDETEKALRVVIMGINAHDEDDRSVMWVPKSCLEASA